MHELVISILQRGFSSGLRLPSLAGKGLPERMRSTAFALLGLTAAAGLALVAIFAQPGFPLLEPAPPPYGPPGKQAVAGAQPVPLGHAAAPAAPATPSPAAVRNTSGGRGDRNLGGGSSEPASGTGGTAVEAPAPVAAPEAAPAHQGGGNGSGGTRHPSPASPPTPAPAPTPVATPKPTSPPPEATVSSPTPEEPVGPGNSASAAAAEHADERGIEASTSSLASPEEGSSPGNGNAYGKGQDN
jgi:hypothetical protein